MNHVVARTRTRARGHTIISGRCRLAFFIHSMIDEHANTWFDVDIDTEASMAGTVDVELESVSDSSSSADNETLTLVRKKR